MRISYHREGDLVFVNERLGDSFKAKFDVIAEIADGLLQSGAWPWEQVKELCGRPQDKKKMPGVGAPGETRKAGKSMSTEIVQLVEGELRVSSLDMAERTENEHASVLRVIRDNLPSLEEFGQVGFEIRAGYNNAKVSVAHLNEPQATLLITYMRNSEIVKTFKLELVKQFYAMKQVLAGPALTDDQIVQQALTILSAKTAQLEAKVEADAPKVEYHERFVAEESDILTVDNFAGQFGSTGPKVRELLRQKGIAARKFLGKRWSVSRERMEDEFEWRARQGVKTSGWFDLRPQHDAPRLHNGQVKQTMYVRQFYAQDLAVVLGLVAADVLGEFDLESAKA